MDVEDHIERSIGWAVPPGVTFDQFKAVVLSQDIEGLHDVRFIKQAEVGNRVNLEVTLCFDIGGRSVRESIDSRVMILCQKLVKIYPEDE